MATKVPIELLRLRSATTAYLAILRGSVPALHGLVITWSPEPERGEPMAELCDSVQAALDVDDAPGTPSAIGAALARLLGEA